MSIDPTKPPAKYWHCGVKIGTGKKYSIVNDLTYEELQEAIVKPWNKGRPFSVSGVIVRSSDSVSEIRISWTQQSKEFYANQHNAAMRASNIADMATDRRALVFSNGEDMTFELLFSGKGAKSNEEPDTVLVERVCRRLPQAARILSTRSRKGKAPYEITDEYDVQDLLHSVLRAYLKYSVQEDPLPKVAGA